MGELGALLELLVDDGIGQLGNGDEGFLELIVVGERIFARLLVGRDHPPHDIGMILGELLAHIEDAPGVGVAVAVEQPRAFVHFVLRHHRVEAGPGIDIATDQQVAAVGVLLHEHRRDVLVGEAGGEQRAYRENVRIGAAHHGNLLALEVGNLRDFRILRRHQRGPFRPRIDVDRLDRVAVDPGDERGRAGGRTEIDRSGVEELERIGRAVGLHPNDLDAVLGELLLQQAFILEQHRHRVIGRPVDVNFLGIVGGAERRARQQGERERAADKRTARKFGHDDLHAFEP